MLRNYYSVKILLDTKDKGLGNTQRISLMFGINEPLI